MFLYVLQINKFKTPVWGSTEIPEGECHRHGIGDMEKTMGSCVPMVIVNFGSDASECTDELNISSAHVQWFSHWKSRAEDHDIIWWHHNDLSCYWGGNYIRKLSTSLGAVIWVFITEWLGQLLKSHQPSTLAISVPLMEQEYNLNELCVLFVYLHVPRPFWGPFSLAFSWVTHYLHPLKPGIGQGMDHNLLQWIAKAG